MTAGQGREQASVLPTESKLQETKSDKYLCKQTEAGGISHRGERIMFEPGVE